MTSRTRDAERRTQSAQDATTERQARCDHVWRYAPESSLPGWKPRRTCRYCKLVEWLTATESGE